MITLRQFLENRSSGLGVITHTEMREILAAHPEPEPEYEWGWMGTSVHRCRSRQVAKDELEDIAPDYGFLVKRRIVVPGEWERAE